MHATGTPNWITELTAEPATPVPGDAWALSWDGAHEGVVVIAQVHDDFVLGIPLTHGEASSTEIPAVLGEVAVTLWPQAETGLGTFLLHRRLGRVLGDAQLREMRRWAAGRGELETLVPGSGAANEDDLMRLLQDYQRRCFIEWPSEAEVTIDVNATGMTPRQFRDATGLDTERVVDLWDGHLLTAEERELVDATWTTHASTIPTRELSSPDVKLLVVELCEATGTSEREARNAARSAYALAARTDSVSERASTRAADTLRLLIQDAHAS